MAVYHALKPDTPKITPSRIVKPAALGTTVIPTITVGQLWPRGNRNGN